MRLKINHFAEYLSIFKEEMCENMKMQMLKRPIKIFILFKGNLNNKLKYKNKILLSFHHIWYY